MSSTELVLVRRDTGEVVPFLTFIDALANGVEVAIEGGTDDMAQLLDALRYLDGEVRTMKAAIQGGLARYSETLGTKTIRLSDGRKAVLKGGTRTDVDPEKFGASLRRAGMPEERVNEIIVETVSYRVDLVKAKQAAAANPKYASALKRASTTTETPVSVSIEKG